MKRLLPVALLLLVSCAKDSSYTASPDTTSNSTSIFIATGSLDIQVNNAGDASLGVVNYRSSYELCGTTAEGLFSHEILPLSDSATFPASILEDGDSLSAEVDMDNNYNISLTIKQDTATIATSANSINGILRQKFLFQNGHKYQFIATVQ
jgi:hypothetical protein